jgi:DNA replication and repair protein RecF
MTADYIHQLTLEHYRNHVKLQIIPESKRVVITGPNGCGKTNILEALSFLSPGRGFRHAKLTDVLTQGADVAHWSLFTDVSGPSGRCTIGTGMTPQEITDEESSKRVLKINHEQQKSHMILPEYLRLVWLTPQMEPLLLSGSTARRRFVDRMVFHFDGEHSKRVSAFERHMRERSKLLQFSRFDPEWLSITEQHLASLSVAITVARMQIIATLMEAMEDTQSRFPKAVLAMRGGAESMLAQASALQVEQELARMLEAARLKDRATGQTSVGAHRSDLEVVHAEKNQPLRSCSTGEQKALLVSILLAEVRATIHSSKRSPILLLDEVVVHLDTLRREALFEEILRMDAQCWMTATEFDWFHPIAQDAHHIELAKHASFAEA